MKIYDLAKEYEMKSTELLKIVNEAGIEKKSHLNTLTEEEVLIVRSKVNKKTNNKKTSFYYKNWYFLKKKRLF